MSVRPLYLFHLSGHRSVRWSSTGPAAAEAGGTATSKGREERVAWVTITLRTRSLEGTLGRGRADLRLGAVPVGQVTDHLVSKNLSKLFFF